MKTLKDLRGYMSLYERNDRATLDDFGSEIEITKLLMKDPKIKKHVGKSGLYFDGGDLVFGDKTVQSGALFSPKFSIGDMKKKILGMPSKAAAEPAKPKAGETQVGRFIAKLPKEMAGVLGNAPTALENPRAIIFANDEDAKMLKSTLHNTKAGIKVRIMKRKNGNQVYIDVKDAETLDSVLDRVSKMK